MNEMHEVLRRVGEIDWSRSSDRGPADQHIVPFIVWRYSTPIALVEQTIVNAVGSFKGAVKWSITTNGRNWTIGPERVAALQAERALRTDTEAIGLLAEEQPEFGRLANQEWPVLARYLEGALRQAGILE